MKHYSFHGLIVLVLLLALQLNIHWAPPDVDLAISGGLLVLVIVAAGFMIQHNRGLCEKCMSKMSLMPDKDAKKYSFRLKLVHFFNWKISAAFIVGILVVSFLKDLPYMFIPWTVMFLSCIYLLMAANTHRKLAPWCPGCRGDGDIEVKPPKKLINA